MCTRCVSSVMWIAVSTGTNVLKWVLCASNGTVHLSIQYVGLDICRMVNRLIIDRNWYLSSLSVGMLNVAKVDAVMTVNSFIIANESHGSVLSHRILLSYVNSMRYTIILLCTRKLNLLMRFRSGTWNLYWIICFGL